MKFKRKYLTSVVVYMVHSRGPCTFNWYDFLYLCKYSGKHTIKWAFLPSTIILKHYDQNLGTVNKKIIQNLI